MVAPLSRQNPGYLPAVLLTLLELPAQGRGAAEGKTTDAPPGAACPAPAHTGSRAASGLRSDSCTAGVSEKSRLPDNTERPKLHL